MEWRRTEYMRQRLEDRITSGRFAGRPIIATDTPIDGGIYLGAQRREAIVVDSAEQPLLMRTYEKMLSLQEEYQRDFGLSSPLTTLFAVFDTIKDNLAYAEDLYEQFVADHKLIDDKPVALSVFLAGGYGVCTHQALLAGFLVERAIKESIINGEVSVDRNSTLWGAHAWARYTESRRLRNFFQRTAYIVDATPRNFVGTLSESLQKASWVYFRESEIAKLARCHPTK